MQIYNTAVIYNLAHELDCWTPKQRVIGSNFTREKIFYCLQSCMCYKVLLSSSPSIFLWRTYY